MSFWERHKERILVGAFIAYVAVLAVGTVDQVFLDSMIFPPALDRQILGMVDVLQDKAPGDVAEARGRAEQVRKRLEGIRLEATPTPVETRLAAFAREGAAVDEGARLLEEARQQAVANLVDNDEFSLRICIRALDPDLVMKLWVPGLSSGDLKVKAGCLEALKKISGQQDGFGYDPQGGRVMQREAIARWEDWYQRFMDERRRPAPAGTLPAVQAPPPGQAPAPVGPDGKPLPPVPAPPAPPPGP